MLSAFSFRARVSFLLFITIFLLGTQADENDDDNDDTETVEAIRRDLKAGSRVIFAAGMIGSVFTLFISGPKGKADFSDGYQVEIEHERLDGMFNFGKVAPLSRYSGVDSSSGIIFAATDATGGTLVTMNSTVVTVLTLERDDSPSQTMIAESKVDFCYDDGNLHFASDDPGTFYLIESDGTLSQVSFNTERIIASTDCYSEYLGKLCMSDKLIRHLNLSQSDSTTCEASLPPEIISGGLASAVFYLFDSKNNVYFFYRGAIEEYNQSYPIFKVDKNIVWSPPTTPTKPTDQTQSKDGNSIILIFLVIVVVVFIVAVGFWYYRKYHIKKVYTVKKDEAQKVNIKGGKKEKSSKKKTINAKTKTSPKGKGGGVKSKVSPKSAKKSNKSKKSTSASET